MAAMQEFICFLLLVASITQAAVGQSSSNGSALCDSTGPRISCGGSDATSCRSQGCCYSPAPSNIGGTALVLPACFRPNADSSTYAVQGAALQTRANGQQQGTLVLQGSEAMPFLGADISPLTLSIQNLDQNILGVKIGAPGRWEVPQDRLFSNTAQGSKQGSPRYTLQYSASPFIFAVSRSDGSSTEPLFNTGGSRLVFKDQYLEISSKIPSSTTLYGLGEQASSTGFALRRDGLPYTLWTRDQPPNVPNVNSYGSHPFIMDVRKGGQAHGVLLLNSNGIDVVLTKTRMQFRAIGGVLDMYFFLGPTPLQVLAQLTSVIGRPVMPPYWSMGLQQSKNGYLTLDYCERVVQNYTLSGIPLETFVTDIPYMDNNQIFTLSADYPLPEFQAFVKRLHAANQRWVPILDSQIHIKQGYAPYDAGIQQNVFVKDIAGNNFVGQLWPGAVHFPDFSSNATLSWWTSQMQAFYNQLPFDGIWIDMNEPSNFCTGDVCTDPGNVGANTDFQCQLSCADGPGAAGSNAAGLPSAGIFKPPYLINNNGTQLDINTKTLPASARHADGSLEYNVHNLYGLSMAIATTEAIKTIRQKRPFTLTRSTFIGSGTYAAHWTGDTASTWDDLKWGPGMMMANGMSGVAFIGGDICGFQFVATEELCARWAAAGAWQPFARNHHAQGFQEFYLSPTVSTVARKVFTWRLRVMPYLYTAFYDAHTFGCSVIRPLFFSFPGDAASYNIDQQWMLGDALMVAPILTQGTISTSAYFPSGVWYNLYDHTTITGGRSQMVMANLTDNTPVFILGGTIVPMGPNGTVTTTAARAGDLTLVAAMPAASSIQFDRCGQGCAGTSQPGNLVACGHMYLDQGEELNVGISLNNYLSFEARLTGSTAVGLQGTLVLFWPGAPGGPAGAGCSANVTWPMLTAISILGSGPVNTASVAIMEIGNQYNADSAFAASGMVQAQSTAPPVTAADGSGSIVSSGLPLPTGNVVYNSITNVLSITDLGYQPRCPSGLKITWSSPAVSQPNDAAG